MRESHWRQVMSLEFQALQAQETWQFILHFSITKHSIEIGSTKLNTIVKALLLSTKHLIAQEFKNSVMTTQKHLVQ